MEEKVYDVLNKLNIDFEKVEHPPLFTSEDGLKCSIEFDGVACKNLFIRNKDKSNYYLVIIPSYKKANLKDVQEKLHETRFSFGSEDVLFEKLRIKSGSVSLLNIIEVEHTDVKFIVDSSLLDIKKIGFHPNKNTITVLFEPQNIAKILDYYHADYEFIEI